jgi:ATPase family associated with various cellular activities (AAA)
MSSVAQAIHGQNRNQMYLREELARIAEKLRRHAEHHALGSTEGDGPRPHDGSQCDVHSRAAEFPVDSLTTWFGLSPFERDVLLLCAGMELDSRFAVLCARAQNHASRPYPTFGLALAALDEAHWSALSNRAPLRYWRLIEIVADDLLTTSALRIDERILHFLVEVDCAEEKLRGLLTSVAVPENLAPSQRSKADELVKLWKAAREASRPMMVELRGRDMVARRAIAATASSRLGLHLNELSAEALPHSTAELEAIARLCDREAILTASALFVEAADIESTEERTPRIHPWSQFLRSLRGVTVVGSKTGFPYEIGLRTIVEVPPLTPGEQTEIWTRALAGQGIALNGEAGRLSAQFRLSSSAICRMTLEAAAALNGTPSDERRGAQVCEALWELCRAEGRQQLGMLADRIEPRASWEDLILAEPQKNVIRQIAVHARQRSLVHEAWGFGERSKRGLGITALFSGESGTGKTLAGEILAAEMGLDLYHIDLSQVVSKYIGETEKNLRRVFEAAEQGGAVLLFDEADALFGKRSEVKDSHDRYANIEVSYLLQRMEAYHGLAILTTNMKDALDPAFLRRIRFVVRFPFPDAHHRLEIWRRSFPPQTPTRDLKFDLLAKLTVTGGSIRNISLHAAFLAAEVREPVSMSHLYAAARGECEKLDRPFTAAEVGGWI